MSEESKNSLDGFLGFSSDANPNEVNFFGEDAKEKPSTKADEEAKKIAAKESGNTSKVKHIDAPDEDDDEQIEEVKENLNFEEADDPLKSISQQQEDTDDLTKKKDDPVASDAISAVNLLKEKDLLSFDLEDGEELSEELAEQILEDNFDDRIESRIGELFKNLPPFVRDFNKFVIDGGNPVTFLESLVSQTTSGIKENMDMTDPVNQELVIRTKLQAEGYDKDYIDTHLTFLKENGKLEYVSKADFKKWNENTAAQQQQLVQQQQQQKEQQKIYRRDLKAKVKDFLSEKEAVESFKLSAGDKRDLPSYMVDEIIPTKSGNNITKMWRDIYSALEDPTKSIILAKLLKNGFDFTKLELQAGTKVAKKVKDGVRRNKNQVPSRSTGSSQKNKMLADYFI